MPCPIFYLLVFDSTIKRPWLMKNHFTVESFFIYYLILIGSVPTNVNSKLWPDLFT